MTTCDCRDPLTILTYVDIAGPATAEAFVAFSAEHTINTDSQKVSWSSDGTTTKIGNADQNVLGSKGDRVNIDWGYLHVLPTDGASAWATGLGPYPLHNLLSHRPVHCRQSQTHGCREQ